MTSRFENQKRIAIERLKNAIEDDEVDRDILGLINYINSLNNFYTTSSCSGRITLLHDLGSKIKNDWLGKWHREVRFDEILDSLSDIPANGIVWFKYESPILHIVSKTIDNAKLLINIARDSGYKRVGIQGLKNERYVVEICDTERVDCPIVDNGNLLVDNNYLKYLTRFSNMKFRNGRKKLMKFEREIKRQIG